MNNPLTEQLRERADEIDRAFRDSDIDLDRIVPLLREAQQRLTVLEEARDDIADSHAEVTEAFRSLLSYAMQFLRPKRLQASLDMLTEQERRVRQALSYTEGTERG